MQLLLRQRLVEYFMDSVGTRGCETANRGREIGEGVREGEGGLGEGVRGGIGGGRERGDWGREGGSGGGE